MRADALKQETKVVTVEACEKIVRSQQIQKAFGDLLQELVADFIAERAIDKLKLITIDIQKSKAGVGIFALFFEGFL